MTNRLVLVRHAEAVEPAPETPDHERSLTEQGVEDARALGQWLKAQGVRPDSVLCSTAARTRETWAGLTESTGFGTLVDHDQRIYDATADDLLEVVREHDAGRVVVLVGHAPGVPHLAATLTEGQADLPDFAAVFGPAGAAILDVEMPWSQLTPGGATVHATYDGRSG